MDKCLLQVGELRCNQSREITMSFVADCVSVYVTENAVFFSNLPRGCYLKRLLRFLWTLNLIAFYDCVKEIETLLLNHIKLLKVDFKSRSEKIVTNYRNWPRNDFQSIDFSLIGFSRKNPENDHLKSFFRPENSDEWRNSEHYPKFSEPNPKPPKWHFRSPAPFAIGSELFGGGVEKLSTRIPAKTLRNWHSMVDFRYFRPGNGFIS